MELFSQLLGSALIVVALSTIFYLLIKKTKFGKLPYMTQQVILGVVFGAAAVFGTEFGVDVGGATANARDAAPLCAGLIFGGPAGIIAGAIGGIERWFAVYWGAGVYSQVACSVSTLLAGIYAAVLRKFMFDDKRPTVGFGAVTAIVMEVVHLSILFVTHLADAERAYTIVNIVTIPMIFCNAAAVALSLLVIMLASKGFRGGRSRIKSISQKVQSWMLISVVLAYLFTTGFVYILQTNTAMSDVEELLALNIQDVKADIRDMSDEKLLSTAKSIAEALDEDMDTSLTTLAVKYRVSEISIINERSLIINSTNPEFVGYDMTSGEQSEEFLVIISDPNVKEYIQDFRQISFSEGGTPIYRKYAAYELATGGFVQIGYNDVVYRTDFAQWVGEATGNRHVGETGYILIADSTGKMVVKASDMSEIYLNQIGINITDADPQSTIMTSEINGEECLWMYLQDQGYYIFAVQPEAEAFENRDAAAYVNSYMEVIVFAILFALIYFLIKKLVVNNIRTVNDNLEQIIGGNLEVTVAVHGSSEFSSLSDDINSTVTTLKHYIAEAAARIDKELEFAKSIQASALPSKFPAFPNNKEFDIYATMATAKEVGGDFYDFYMLDEERLAFLIADVSGKGIPAAMFMMRAKTMIKNLAEENLPVNEIFTRANARLCEGNDAGMFVTAWIGIMNIRTGHVEFANAGHNPPVICRNDGGYDYLVSRAGFVLAGMDGVCYRKQELDLKPGERIYLYTDGVTEATDSEKKLYGEDRLKEYLNNNKGLNAEETLRGVKVDIDKFVGEAEQFDDITMLMVDYVGKEELIMTERVFPATTEALTDATAFLEEEMEKADCGMKTAMQLSVAMEEIFVNVAHYAYPDGNGDVTLGIGVDDGVMTIQFADSGVPFDPLAKADPDITLSAEDRKIGGLGIYMVKKTMDSVSYEYKDGKNILTLTKRI